jgi:hypothetical protein
MQFNKIRFRTDTLGKRVHRWCSFMKKWVSVLLVCCLAAFAMPTSGQAAQQRLPALSSKFYPDQELVFVDFHNVSPSPLDNIIINMRVREGAGSNRVIAAGQARLPTKLTIRPGERASARVPIFARSLRELPAAATFDFRITGRQLPDNTNIPDVVVQDSPSGKTLEFGRDSLGIPTALGFIELNPSLTAEVRTQVQVAILTFYDQERKVVWSETIGVNARLTNNESVLLWGRYEQMTSSLVPEISSVEVIFSFQ